MKTYSRQKYSFLSEIIEDIGKTTEEVSNSNKKKSFFKDIKVNAFFKTWLEYCCKEHPCYNKKCVNGDSNCIDSFDLAQFAFYILIGKDYTDKTMKNIIKRLIRIRHILKYEGGSFEQLYESFHDNLGYALGPVLDPKDGTTNMRYKILFDQYKNYIELSNVTLSDTFIKNIKEVISEYDSIDEAKTSITNLLNVEAFFNEEMCKQITINLLVIVFEFIMRFYEYIGINPYNDKNIPTSLYVEKFFEVERIVYSNKRVFVFLNNHKSIMIYNFETPVNEAEERMSPNLYKFQFLKVINDLRNISILHLDQKITNIWYNESNIILKLEDGDYIINGSNQNNKMDSSYIHNSLLFHNFNYGYTNEIEDIKIYDNYILILTIYGEIIVKGNVTDPNGIFNIGNTDKLIDDLRLYVGKTSLDTYSYFYLNEKKNVFVPTNTKCVNENVVAIENDIYSFENDTNILIKNGNEYHTFEDPLPEKSGDFVINRLIELEDEAMMIECMKYIEDVSYKYFYYVFGKNNDNSRLGFTNVSYVDPFDLENMNKKEVDNNNTWKLVAVDEQNGNPEVVSFYEDADQEGNFYLKLKANGIRKTTPPEEQGSYPEGHWVGIAIPKGEYAEIGDIRAVGTSLITPENWKAPMTESSFDPAPANSLDENEDDPLPHWFVYWNLDTIDSSKTVYFTIKDKYRVNVDLTECLRDIDIIEFHDISDDIQVDKAGEINRSIRIDKMCSHKNRTVLLNSSGVVLGAGLNAGYFCDKPSLNVNIDSEESQNIEPRFTKIVFNDDIVPTYDIVLNDESDKSMVILYNNLRSYCFGSRYIYGFKNGGGYLLSDTLFETKRDSEENNSTTSPQHLSLFSTKRCIYTQNPLFDILSNTFIELDNKIQIKDLNINFMKKNLKYIMDISVKGNSFDAYKTKLRNLENTSDFERNINKSFSAKVTDYHSQDVSNFVTHRYMISDYMEDVDYSYFAAFLNIIGMYAECIDYEELTEVYQTGRQTKKEFRSKISSFNKEIVIGGK